MIPAGVEVAALMVSRGCYVFGSHYRICGMLRVGPAHGKLTGQASARATLARASREPGDGSDHGSARFSRHSVVMTHGILSGPVRLWGSPVPGDLIPVFLSLRPPYSHAVYLVAGELPLLSEHCGCPPGRAPRWLGGHTTEILKILMGTCEPLYGPWFRSLPDY